MKRRDRFIAAFTACLALSAPAFSAESPAQYAAEELRRFKTDEARQGVAVDAKHFYAVTNSQIGKYDKASGQKVAEWKGDPALTKHINSCNIIDAKLVCANSNYPETPMASSVEIFDPATLRHVESISLGNGIGSLTWIDRKDGFWWAAFANYAERGGEPGRDHTFTTFVKFDGTWQKREGWIFPQNILERFKPMSSSGGVWGDDGLLYVTGHDHPELYVLRLPEMGPVLQHVATIAAPIEGQAITWDHGEKRILYGITRASREVIVMRLPAIPAPD